MNIDQMYKEVFYLTNDGIAICDSKQKIIDINPAFTEIFGYSVKEVKGKYIDDLFSSDKEIYEDAKKISEKTFKGEKNVYETTRINKFSEKIPVKIIAFPIKENDRIVGIFGIFREQISLKKAETKYKRIVDSLPEEIYIATNNNFENEINKYKDSIYHSFSKENQNHIKKSINLSLERKRKINYTVKIRNKANEEVYYEIKIIGIDQNEVLLIIRNISIERKEIYEKNRLNVFYDFLSKAIQDVLSSELNENTYQKILDYAVSAIPEIDGGSVLEKREDSLYHFVAMTDNYNRKILMNFTFKPHELANNESDKIEIKEDIDLNEKDKVIDSERLERLEESHTYKEIKAMISIPILMEKKKIYFFLDSFKVRKFKPEVVKMGLIFAQQIEVLIKRLSLEKEVKKQLHQLEFYAYNDALTSLPNRRAFINRIKKVIENTALKSLQIVYIDLDEFKIINDSSGHPYPG